MGDGWDWNYYWLGLFEYNKPFGFIAITTDLAHQQKLGQNEDIFPVNSLIVTWNLWLILFSKIWLFLAFKLSQTYIKMFPKF
jgi:hypothetical protein